MTLKGWIDHLPRRLSRVTTSGLVIPEIDGLRFVAIFMVFLFHASGYTQAKCGLSAQSDALSRWAARLIEHFGFGVQLFFVISGFILALPFAAHHLEGRPRVKLKSYYFRRVTRLEPPYIANLLLAFVLLVLIKKESFNHLLPHLLASLSYLHNLIYGEVSLINHVAWSLEIEVQFYLLAPLLGLVFALPSRRWRRCLLVAGCILPVCLQQTVRGLPFCILRYLQYFMLGFLLADIYLADWRRRPMPHWHWDIISLLAWPAMLCLFHTRSVKAWLLPPCVLLCYLGAFKGVLFNRLFQNRWLVAIGGMCYTIYLYHFLIISFAGRWSARHTVGELFWPNLLLQAAWMGVWVLAGSAILFLAIEKPCMYRDWPSRFWAAFQRNLRPAFAKVKD